MHKKNTPLLNIFLMHHGRTEFLKEALFSLKKISQNDKVLITFSDNSENKKTPLDDILINNRNFQFQSSSYPCVFEHYKFCIRKNTAKYFMFFHDDDIIMENYFENTVEFLEKNLDFAACGTNAEVVDKHAKRISKHFFYQKEMETILSNPSDLMEKYVHLGRTKYAPFPSYTYRAAMLYENMIVNDSGKVSDVSFLLRILQKNPIAWINKNCMYYRLHESNDSKVIKVHDRIKLKNVYKKISHNTVSNLNIKKLNLFVWRSWIKTILKNPYHLFINRKKFFIILKNI